MARWTGGIEKRELAGVLCVCLPYPSSRGRRLAFGSVYTAASVEASTHFIQRDFRTITRVVVEPRFRGAGVSKLMLREAMKHHETRFLESMAVMARFVPFFQRAGFREYDTGLSIHDCRYLGALENIGLDLATLCKAQDLHAMVDGLVKDTRRFLRSETERWLKSRIQRQRLSGVNFDLVEVLKLARGALKFAPLYLVYDFGVQDDSDHKSQ